MKRETLFLFCSLTGNLWFLADARDHVLATFKTEAEARKWAEEFGYNIKRK